MAEYYLGEIRLFSFAANRIPQNFVPCDGRSIAIQSNQALYAVIGVTYGGDGINTFKVPDLRGRVPVHVGQATGSTNIYTIGQTAGADMVSLTIPNLPTHNHTANISNSAATTLTPSPMVMQAQAANGALIYCDATQPGAIQTFAPNTIQPSNNSTPGPLPHLNVQPTYVLNYAICVLGLFPYHS